MDIDMLNQEVNPAAITKAGFALDPDYTPHYAVLTHRLQKRTFNDTECFTAIVFKSKGRIQYVGVEYANRLNIEVPPYMIGAGVSIAAQLN